MLETENTSNNSRSIRLPWVTVLGFLMLVLSIPVGHLYYMYHALGIDVKAELKLLQATKANSEDLKAIQIQLSAINETVQSLRLLLAGRPIAKAPWRDAPRSPLAEHPSPSNRGEGQFNPGWPAKEAVR